MKLSTPEPFVAPPVVKQHVILLAGCAVALFASAVILTIAFALSLFIPHCFRTIDGPNERRLLYEQFKQRPDPMIRKFLAVPDCVHVEERYWVNSRNMALCTSVLTPKNQEPKAVLFFCHGYGADASFLPRHNMFSFVKQGIAVVTIEYEGHGRSDGPLSLIYDFDRTVGDAVDYFQEVARERFRGKKCFLMGESMGGAVAYLAYEKMPSLFHGVVFVSPMCKISDEVKPPQWIVDLLLSCIGPVGSNGYLGFLPITPTKQDVDALTHRDAIMKDLSMAPPFGNFGRPPRLTTAREFLYATSHITSTLASFDAPFLVQHGKDDKVTDPKLSQALYDEAKSTDKSIKLYDGMWHAITGDVPSDTEIVLNDSIQWVLKRI